MGVDDSRAARLRFFIDSLLRNGDQVRFLTESLSEREMRTYIPDDEFCALDHISHLRDTERGVVFLQISALLATHHPRLSSFQCNESSKPPKHEAADPAEALVEFLAARERNVKLLRIAPYEALRRRGVYTDKSAASLDEVLQNALEHDERHIWRLIAIQRHISRS